MILKLNNDPLSVISLFRRLFASFAVALSDLISKLFSLVGSLADINFMKQFGNDIMDRFYIFVGIFVLFKAAIIVIRYVINPDEIVDKKKGAQKFIINIVISLAMLTAAPTLFDQIFNVQAIVLNENVLGKLVFGPESSDDSNNTISDFGKRSTYYLFSSFIHYNVNSDLKPLFEDCPNIFRELDTNYSTATFSSYCGSDYLYYRCATFLTKGANVHMDFSTEDYLQNYYYDSNYFIYDSRSNISLNDFSYYNPLTDMNANEKKMKKQHVSYYGTFKVTPSESADNYKYTVNVPFKGETTIGNDSCEEHMVNSGYCGVANGIYLYWLIQRGRITNDVSLIYKHEIIDATEDSNLLFEMKKARGEVNYDQGDVNKDDPDGGVCTCDATGSDRDADKCNNSAGDYVFDFNVFLPILCGLFYLVILFFLCIDIGIRAVKLAFLRVMSPIAFVSYMDVTESKLFGQWLKAFLNAFLDLFIKLGCIYLAAYISDIILSDGFKITTNGDDSFAKIVFFIGCFFFAKEIPDFISKLLNLGGDQGSISYMKKATSYMFGLGKKAVLGAASGAATFASGAAVGAMTNAGSNIKSVINAEERAKMVNNFRNASTKREKIDFVLQKFPLVNSVSGALSTGFRAVGNQMRNGGKFSKQNILEAADQNRMAREASESGNRFFERAGEAISEWNTTMTDNYMGPYGGDEKKQINIKNEVRNTSRDKLSEAYDKAKSDYNDIKNDLTQKLTESGKYAELMEAFSAGNNVRPKNFEESLKYKTFNDFNTAHANKLDEYTYNEFKDLFEKQYYAKFKVDEFKKRNP